MRDALLIDELDFDVPVPCRCSRRDLESPAPAADLSADAIFNWKIPVPDTNCPGVSTVPRPGCFYKIQAGEGGFLTTVGRAYGLKPGAERLAMAERVNNHPYNQLFWTKGQWPFETGQIDFNPRFANSFDRQVQGLRTSGYPKAPKGHGFAVIWLPSPAPRKLPQLKGSCSVPNVSTRYWLAAYRIAYDAWLSLDAMVREPDDFFSQLEWDTGRLANGSARAWFGPYSRRRLQRVHRRMGNIVDVFRSPRKFVIKCRFDIKGAYATSLPGVRRIVLKEYWETPPPAAQKRTTVERIQTFIHEVAHIANLSSATERKKYGPMKSRCIAIDAPRQAGWNADNYGYFAVAQALIAPYQPPTLNYANHCKS